MDKDLLLFAYNKLCTTKFVTISGTRHEVDFGYLINFFSNQKQKFNCDPLIISVNEFSDNEINDSGCTFVLDVKTKSSRVLIGQIIFKRRRKITTSYNPDTLIFKFPIEDVEETFNLDYAYNLNKLIGILSESDSKFQKTIETKFIEDRNGTSEELIELLNDYLGLDTEQELCDHICSGEDSGILTFWSVSEQITTYDQGDYNPYDENFTTTVFKVLVDGCDEHFYIRVNSIEDTDVCSLVIVKPFKTQIVLFIKD